MGGGECSIPSWSGLARAGRGGDVARASRQPAWAKGEQGDLMLSNPPYIPSDQSDTLQPEVRDHDPRLALDGGPDGLRFYRMLAAEGRSRLNLGGRLMAEFGDGQEQSIAKLFREANWLDVGIADDLSDRPRIVIASAEH